MPLLYLDRKTQSIQEEGVYGGKLIEWLYGNHFWSKWIALPLLSLICKNALFSSVYGWFQKQKSSCYKIKPFIEKFGVDPTEFLDPIENFSSFNDFFIRKLRPEARPIAPGDGVAIIPADGRYRFYPNLQRSTPLMIKGESLDLASLLQDERLAASYVGGTMIVARLCPSDYHRYHFPCDGTPGASRLINGWLYSVNPAAIRKNLGIFAKNKRSLCKIFSPDFGELLFIEVGATCVGTIQQTYTPGRFYRRGEEKGYFSFGGSSLVLLFQPGSLQLDADLPLQSEQEVRCLMGSSMGRAHHS